METIIDHPSYGMNVSIVDVLLLLENPDGFIIVLGIIMTKPM